MSALPLKADIMPMLPVQYRSEPMSMWPISTRVNKPENYDESLLDPVETLVG